MLGVPDEYAPKPSSKYLPDWYKDMDSYVGGEKQPNGMGQTVATIKRCMPVFDAINTGYIIPTPTDIWIKQVNIDEEDSTKTQPVYEWPGIEIINFHPVEQAPNYPNNPGHSITYPKWINPWSIKTPPGYSTAFVQPWHRKSMFTILPGVVDTDQYTSPVNFPFVLNDIKFEGLIPAGTPMAQVIPFKRDSWEMEFGGVEDSERHRINTLMLRSRFFDSYKDIFRQKKEYK